MPVPTELIARLAIPLVVTSLLFLEDLGPEQVRLYDRISRRADEKLSQARGEGAGPPERYDYIIVGAGSAGAIVANRLSASGEFSVLLLDGGGNPNPVSDILFAKRHTSAAGDMGLPYRSVPQANACLEAGSCALPRAKVLGGCSVVNSCVYNRCKAKDYEFWAEFANDTTWGFENVLEAYKRIESYHGEHEDDADPNHGTEGEVYVSKVDYTPGSDVILAAFAEMGLPSVDLNTGSNVFGFSKIDLNVRSGIRQSTYHAFLQPIEEERPNLKIYRYAWATKVYFDFNKKAVGVTYVRHNQTVYVEAEKEVILSAGVFDTPKLLMLSGIGPAEHLAEFGIATVEDSPAVGNYLQDHVTARLATHPLTVNQTFGLKDVYSDEALLQYIENGTGSLLGFEIGGAWSTPVAMGYLPGALDQEWPDVQIFVHERIAENEDGSLEEQFFINHVLMNPQSYGTVRLRSTNPTDAPVIDPQFLSVENDLERLVDGIEVVIDYLLGSPLLQSLGIRWSDKGVKLAACEEHAFPSRDYWRCYARQKSSSDMHPTSTCRMGPNSTVAVVDSKLRVFGTSGLRVIDASVMPTVPSGNTHFPAMMVGEIGAQIILQGD